MEKYWAGIKNSKFLGGSFALAVGSLTAGALNYLFHLAIGRMVDVKTYGEVVSVISIFQIVSFPVGVLGIVATWYSAKDKVGENFRGAYEKLKLFSRKLFKFGIPVLAVFMLVTPPVSRFLKIENHWALNLVWLAAFFSIFFGWAGGVINGLQRFKELSYANVIGTLVKLISGLILVKIGLAAAGVSASFLFGSFSSFLVVIFVVRLLAQRNKSRELQDNIQIENHNIKRFVLFAFIGFLFFNILSSADMILAKHNLSAEEAGYYGALLVAAKAIIFISGSIATVFFAMSSEEGHAKEKSNKLFWQSAGITGLFCLISCFFYFLFPKFILRLFFGQTYLNQAHYLIWFAVLASVFSLANIIFFHFISKERFKELMVISVIPAIEVAFIYFFGHNITSIVLIAVLAQLVFFLSGAALILTKNQQRGAKKWIKS